MKIVGIIPARFASTRLPGKPLAILEGKSLIKRVYENALQFDLDELIVATDDERIASEINGKVIMTPSDLKSGTVRVAWAAKALDADVIINIQGDEPFILKEQIKTLAKSFEDESVEIATLCYHLKSQESLLNPATVKLVKDHKHNALYFSRSPIPFLRNEKIENWTTKYKFLKHVGIYAYRKNILLEIIKYAGSELENAESLEQLAWLENGYSIKVLETEHECFSIDTPQDLEKARHYIQQQEN